MRSTDQIESLRAHRAMATAALARADEILMQDRIPRVDADAAHAMTVLAMAHMQAARDGIAYMHLEKR